MRAFNFENSKEFVDLLPIIECFGLGQVRSDKRHCLTSHAAIFFLGHDKLNKIVNNHISEKEQKEEIIKEILNTSPIRNHNTLISLKIMLHQHAAIGEHKHEEQIKLFLLKEVWNDILEVLE